MVLFTLFILGVLVYCGLPDIFGGAALTQQVILAQAIELSSVIWALIAYVQLVSF